MRRYVCTSVIENLFFVFYRRPENATTYCQIYVPARAIRMYTGSTANLANDFLTRNRTIQELAATCKYAFRKFLLLEYMLILIITNYVV